MAASISPQDLPHDAPYPHPLPVAQCTGSSTLGSNPILCPPPSGSFLRLLQPCIVVDVFAVLGPCKGQQHQRRNEEPREDQQQPDLPLGSVDRQRVRAGNGEGSSLMPGGGPQASHLPAELGRAGRRAKRATLLALQYVASCSLGHLAAPTPPVPHTSVCTSKHRKQLWLPQVQTAQGVGVGGGWYNA